MTLKPTNVFSFKGRLNRQAYILRVLPLSIASRCCVVLLESKTIQLPLSVPTILFLGGLAAIVLIVFCLIKRLHDLNRSGWWALLVAVPFLNALGGLYLAFKKGTPGPNRFGEDPLSETPAPAAA